MPHTSTQITSSGTLSTYINLGSCDAPSSTLSQGDPVQLKPQTLLRHMMALGSSGSGKTVLSKIVVEEMCRLGLPAICIDPQGDICSLAYALTSGEVDTLSARGVTPELADQFRERVEVVIFTPASRKGIALSADPMNIDIGSLSEAERVQSISSVATMITSLIGYDLSSDDGEGISAAFDSFLTSRFELGTTPASLDEFSKALSSCSEEERAQLERFVNAKKLDEALRKLARLDVGARRLMFHEGIPLSIDLLFGRGPNSCNPEGKTRLSVIYLNTLNSAEDKEFIIATLAEQLYAWMLKNPSKAPQGLFYIDEVAPFIPPVRVPACKPSLSLIFKQARKYGVCCLMATQNPGDVDYKAMAQFGTWAIGRLTTRQDQKKIQPTINALDPDRADEIMSELPTLQAGEFMLLCPDEYSETVKMKTRWLYTKHETLDDNAIERLCNQRWRTRFEGVETQINKERRPSRASELTPSSQGDISPASSQQSLADVPAGPLPISSDERASSSSPSLREERVELQDLRSDEERAMDEALKTGEALSATDLAAKIGVSRQKAGVLLKAASERGELAHFQRGRSKMFYRPASGARPDLELSERISALMPKMTREELEKRIEENRQKRFLGFFGRDEKLKSKRLTYRVLYQVKFREDVKRTGLTSVFGAKFEEREDFIYLEPSDLQIYSYLPNEPIQKSDQPAEFAALIPDFDGVSEITELAPGSVSLDEDAWNKRQGEDEVKVSLLKRYPALKISSISPILLPIWLLRYQEENEHSLRLVHIDGLTGAPLLLNEAE